MVVIGLLQVAHPQWIQTTASSSISLPHLEQNIFLTLATLHQLRILIKTFNLNKQLGINYARNNNTYICTEPITPFGAR